MRGRRTIWALGAILAVLAVSQAQSPRVSFELATGSTAGTYFPVGELIAGIVSHPRGLARCDAAGVCGPAGLMVSARTSEGAVGNVLAVNEGSVDSGLAQANIVADAVAGQGAFRKPGRQTHVRAIANLFPETVQLVVATDAHIAKIADLRGKAVSLDVDGSGAAVIGREILTAYGVSEKQLKVHASTYDVSAILMLQGKLDAFFFEGGSPAPLVGDLVRRGVAKLIPIDGKGRRRLLAKVPGLTAATIPAGVYPGVAATATVSSRTLWVVKDSASPDVVYGILRALFHPANRVLLDSSDPAARFIRLDQAASGLTAPLHPGAERFYRDMGKLSEPVKHD